MQQEQAGLRGSSNNSSSSSSNNNYNSSHYTQPPALNTLPVPSQQFFLMRDLLLALSGVEGQYIRIAAAASTTGGSGIVGEGDGARGDARRRAEHVVTAAVRSSQAGGNIIGASLPRISDTHFLIDLDTADRSVANQVGAVGTANV